MCLCRIDLNNCDSKLWTYVIDNWNNWYLGIYRLYVGFGIQGICVYFTYTQYSLRKATVKGPSVLELRGVICPGEITLQLSTSAEKWAQLRRLLTKTVGIK